MSEKLRIAVLFGGRSGEHEVSLLSARSVLEVLDAQKYTVHQIGITHDGAWLSGSNVLEKFKKGDISDLKPAGIYPDPSRKGLYLLQNSHWEKQTDLDLVFPVLHGTFGEDGTLQGLMEMADLAYVGAGVTGSSVGMDKGVFKDVMRGNKIPVVDSIIVLRSEVEQNLEKVISQATEIAPFPLFVKPANLGSSVGISKCNNSSDLAEGLLEAADYDRRILIERGVEAREIEVSVLGNDQPLASVPGEVVPSREFYSYESKYADGTSNLIIPAPLTPDISQKIRQLAVLAYKAIDCAGMARVDFFYEKGTGKVMLNELNTIPGFTSISMYPKLWEASGISYTELIDRLIDLALERKASRDRTQHHFRRTS